MSWKDYETLDTKPEKATKEEIKKLKEKYGLVSSEEDNEVNTLKESR